MSQKLTSALVALAITGAALASAGQAIAGSNGYIWEPFYCNDHPGETRCKAKR